MQKLAAFYRGDHRFAVEAASIAPPAEGEVQIEVEWCGICGTDLHVFHGHMDKRVGHNRVIGHEMSGTIAAVGAGVSGWEVSDRVVVRPLHPCGQCPACRAGNSHICHNLKFLGLDSDGAMQQLWNVPAFALHRLPEHVPFDVAALIEPLAVACHDVRRARLASGETALVIGGGPIGMLIAMVARQAGARVFVSEINQSRLALAERLGFTGVNPRDGDVAQRLLDATGDAGADVVFEVSGTQAGVDLMTAAVCARGRIVMVAIHATKPTVDLFRFFWREIEMQGARVYEAQDYDQAIELVASKQLDVGQLITSRHALSDIQAAFEALSGSPSTMKSLIKCQLGAPV